MPYTQDLVDEINILVRYNLSTTQEGIKVHKTAAYQCRGRAGLGVQ